MASLIVDAKHLCQIETRFFAYRGFDPVAPERAAPKVHDWSFFWRLRGTDLVSKPACSVTTQASTTKTLDWKRMKIAGRQPLLIGCPEQSFRKSK
jgi:hypothetical protein